MCDEVDKVVRVYSDLCSFVPTLQRVEASERVASNNSTKIPFSIQISLFQKGCFGAEAILLKSESN